MAATLGRSGIQPPSEGCFDPVITVLVLEQRIEEKYEMQANRHQKAPNGHSVNIDVRVMAFFLGTAGKKRGARRLAMAVCQTTQC
jgi:hypothetical protein